jgi:hypothetical protein
MTTRPANWSRCSNTRRSQRRDPSRNAAASSRSAPHIPRRGEHATDRRGGRRRARPAYFFRSKEGLYDAVPERAIARRQEALARACAAGDEAASAEDAVRVLRRRPPRFIGHDQNENESRFRTDHFFSRRLDHGSGRSRERASAGGAKSCRRLAGQYYTIDVRYSSAKSTRNSAQRGRWSDIWYVLQSPYWRRRAGSLAAFLGVFLPAAWRSSMYASR